MNARFGLVALGLSAFVAIACGGRTPFDDQLAGTGQTGGSSVVGGNNAGGVTGTTGTGSTGAGGDIGGAGGAGAGGVGGSFAGNTGAGGNVGGAGGAFAGAGGVGGNVGGAGGAFAGAGGVGGSFAGNTGAGGAFAGAGGVGGSPIGSGGSIGTGAGGTFGGMGGFAGSGVAGGGSGMGGSAVGGGTGMGGSAVGGGTGMAGSSMPGGGLGPKETVLVSALLGHFPGQACQTCVSGVLSCSSAISGCAENERCLTGILCAANACKPDDLICQFSCLSRAPLGEALTSVACVYQTCGAPCRSNAN